MAFPTPQERRRNGVFSTAVWGIPTENTLDRATGMLPDLMYQRLDEFGIDFAVLYPTYGLTVTALPNDELRRALARGHTKTVEGRDGHRDHRLRGARYRTRRV